MTTDFASNSIDRFNAVTLQGDKIVAAGHIGYGGGAAVARYPAIAGFDTIAPADRDSFA